MTTTDQPFTWTCAWCGRDDLTSARVRGDLAWCRDSHMDAWLAAQAARRHAARQRAALTSN